MPGVKRNLRKRRVLQTTVNTAKLMKKTELALSYKRSAAPGYESLELIYITVDSVHTVVAFATVKARAARFSSPISSECC